MTSLYFLINIASFSIPFLYSFQKKMRFIQYWKPVFLAILIVAISFLIWDVWFTNIGVWGFNPAYLLGPTIVNLPFEEVLFFFCIPYASIFTHYAVGYFFPNLQLSKKVTDYITIVLFFISVVVLILNSEKWYTFVNFSVFLLQFSFNLDEKNSVFLLSFLIIKKVLLVPSAQWTGCKCN